MKILKEKLEKKPVGMIHVIVAVERNIRIVIGKKTHSHSK